MPRVRSAYVIAVVSGVVHVDGRPERCGVVCEDGVEDGDTAVTAAWALVGGSDVDSTSQASLSSQAGIK